MWQARLQIPPIWHVCTNSRICILYIYTASVSCAEIHGIIFYSSRETLRVRVHVVIYSSANLSICTSKHRCSFLLNVVSFYITVLHTVSCRLRHRYRIFCQQHGSRQPTTVALQAGFSPALTQPSKRRKFIKCEMWTRHFPLCTLLR